MITHRLQLRLLVLDLFDDPHLLSFLGFEVGFHGFDRGPFLLELGDLAPVFPNDDVEEDHAIHQVGEIRGGEDELKATDLATLVHDSHAAAEVGDMLRQFGLLERQLFLGLVDLLRQ